MLLRGRASGAKPVGPLLKSQCWTVVPGLPRHGGGVRSSASADPASPRDADRATERMIMLRTIDVSFIVWGLLFGGALATGARRMGGALGRHRGRHRASRCHVRVRFLGRGSRDGGA